MAIDPVTGESIALADLQKDAEAFMQATKQLLDHVLTGRYPADPNHVRCMIGCLERAERDLRAAGVEYTRTWCIPQ